MVSLMLVFSWSVVLKVLRSDLVTSVASDGSNIELSKKTSDDLVLRKDFARMKHR